MSVIRIKGLEIGAWRPKVCVPLCAASAGEALQLAREYATNQACELVEWRVDYFEDCKDAAAVCDLLSRIAELLADKPLLVTVRTAAEGGFFVGDEQEYLDLLCSIARTGCADLIDLEYCRCLDAAAAVANLKAEGVYVVGSWHDFSSTPHPDAVFRHMQNMAEAGCDIVKVACMANGLRDVAVMRAVGMRATMLLNALTISISMGEFGMNSRVAAADYGSCISFGTIGDACAPGQVPATELMRALTDRAEEGE